MEAIGAGSSVLAFVCLALKSAKAIHSLLSAVRDGPQNVHHLVDDIAQLQSILERLSHLKSGSITQTDALALQDTARRCASDMDHLEVRLQRLSISPTEGHAGKLWKRLKITIGEKDLDHMRSVVHSHALMLNVNLGMSQAAQMSASQAQQSEILEMLKQLQREVVVLRETADSTGARPTGFLATDATTIDPPGTPAVDPKLDESISRLIALVTEKEHTVASKDAQQMIDDLQTLLESAQKQESIASMPTPPTETDASSEDQPNDPTQSISRELMFSAPSIGINKNGPSRLTSSIDLGTAITQDRKRKSIDISGGALTIYTNRRTRRRREPLGDRENGNDDIQIGRDFIAKIQFRPKNSQSMLEVTVSQAQLLAGSFLSIPNLSVNNVIPRNSEVFKLAQQGRTDDILALIADGKASLRDRDELGWSLLHHACEWQAFTLCKFLIQNGLDVDEGVFYEDEKQMVTPLHLAIDHPVVGALRFSCKLGRILAFLLEIGWASSIYYLAVAGFCHMVFFEISSISSHILQTYG